MGEISVLTSVVLYVLERAGTILIALREKNCLQRIHFFEKIARVLQEKVSQRQMGAQ